MLCSFRICKILRRFLRDENLGSLNFSNFLKKSFFLSESSQGKTKTAPYRAHETTTGTIRAVRIRPDIVNSCHGEVGVCKSSRFVENLSHLLCAASSEAARPKYPRAGLAECMVFAVVQPALVTGSFGEIHEAEGFFLASAHPSG